MAESLNFTEEQKQYLQGFMRGVETIRTSKGQPPLFPIQGISFMKVDPGKTSPRNTPNGPDASFHVAQDRFLAEGKKLSKEEEAKREEHPLDIYWRIKQTAEKNEFPEGMDVFRWKYHGLFYSAPTQNSYMCRLRIPHGILTARQLEGVAGLTDRFGNGYAHVTTRANLQVREIGAENGVQFIEGLFDLGLTTKGSGADNVRNITGSPTAGIDPMEILDTRPIARDLHFLILNNRELFGLPRKFNIAFDGGGRVSVLEDTNDIGFQAVRVGEGKSVDPGIYLHLTLGGITGHKDFAKNTGVLVTPGECPSVTEAVLKAFIEAGDRTFRHKARLKYVLDSCGLEHFLSEMETKLGRSLRRVPISELEPKYAPKMKDGHIGIHPQKQENLSYIGVALPVGKITTEQMRVLSSIASEQGSGTIRLTVWQNLLISDIPHERLEEAKKAIEACGLHWSTSNVRAGLVACTGNTGCSLAATNTKANALSIAVRLEEKLALDRVVNIHLTGCPNSCAQHYIGDIGLMGATVEDEDDSGEAYHVYLGGGYGDNEKIGREIYRDIKADKVPEIIERMLKVYLSNRESDSEDFQTFVNRFEISDLSRLFDSSSQ